MYTYVNKYIHDDINFLLIINYKYIRVCMYLFLCIVCGFTNSKNKASKIVDNESIFVFEPCLNVTNRIIENCSIDIVDDEYSDTMQHSNTGITLIYILIVE